MRKLRLRKPSPALFISCLALFVALSGTSYAVVVLPKNSVGTKQLRNNAVKSAKIADNQVTGADVNEATLGQVPSAASAGSANTANTAGTAGLLDGIDSTGFLQNGAAAGGDLTGSYPNPNVGSNAVGGAEVTDGSLTGSDVVESSFSEVPQAQNADQFAGRNPRDYMRSNIYRKFVDTTGTGGGDEESTGSASCDNTTFAGGDTMVSGGFDLVDSGTRIIGSWPGAYLIIGQHNTWFVKWENNSTPDTVRVWVLCARGG